MSGLEPKDDKMATEYVIATNNGQTTWFTGIIDGATVVISLEKILWDVMNTLGYKTTQLFKFLSETTFTDIDGNPVELVADSSWN